MDLEPGKVNTVRADSVTYNSCTFNLLEDFDQAGIRLIRSPYYTDSIHIISDPSVGLLEKNCGAALLSANDPSFWFQSNDSMYFPQGCNMYEELNYKSNYPFTVGLQAFIDGVAVNNGDDIIILNPSATWQKIYVNLGLASALEPSATWFKIYMYGVLDLTKQSSAAIYFDNIKVIRNG